MIMEFEEIQRFLNDNNTTLEEYLKENIFTDEERKDLQKKWDLMLMEAIYKNIDT